MRTYSRNAIHVILMLLNFSMAIIKEILDWLFFIIIIVRFILLSFRAHFANVFMHSVPSMELLNEKHTQRENETNIKTTERNSGQYLLVVVVVHGMVGVFTLLSMCMSLSSWLLFLQTISTHVPNNMYGTCVSNE